MADSEFVTIRHPHTKDELRVGKDAVPFFPGYEVLDSSGRPSAKATAAATEKKES